MHRTPLQNPGFAPTAAGAPSPLPGPPACRRRSAQRAALALLAAGLVACGGGGGDSAPAPALAPPPTAAPPASPPAPPGGTAGALAVRAALASGSTLEFLATHELQSSSAAGSSSTQDHGLFRVTLGAPATVAGVAGFEVQVSGKTQVGGHEFRPGWTFLAQVGSRWLGSSDGRTLFTLYDPEAAEVGSGFFAGATDAHPLSATPGRFDGAYNRFDGVALGAAASDGGCSRVLTLTICSDTATSFSEREWLVDGIGPVGWQQSLGYSTGGSAPQVLRRTRSIELVGSSLAARDGTPVQPPPWSPAPPLPLPRFDALAVAMGSQVYLFGGTGATAEHDPRRVDRLDTATGTWQRLPDAPRSLAGWHGCVLGSRIALFGGSDGLILDPASGHWTPTSRLLATGAVSGVGCRTRADGRHEVIAIVDRGATYADAALHRYLPDTRTWQSLGSFERGLRGRYSAVMHGERFLLIGGFADGGYLRSVSALDIASRSVTRSFAQLDEGVQDAAVAVHEGRVVVAGGVNFGGQRRRVQFIDLASGAVSGGADLLGGLQGAAAAVADGRLYLFGGKAGDEHSTARDEAWLLRR